jgi:hypothetical protein
MAWGLGGRRAAAGLASENHASPHSTTDRAPRGYFIGAYQALAKNGTAFKALLVQTNSGNTANGTDFFTTTIMA